MGKRKNLLNLIFTERGNSFLLFWMLIRILLTLVGTITKLPIAGSLVTIGRVFASIGRWRNAAWIRRRFDRRRGLRRTGNFVVGFLHFYANHFSTEINGISEEIWNDLVLRVWVLGREEEERLCLYIEFVRRWRTDILLPEASL